MLNSRSWRDEYFKEKCDSGGGGEWTRYFMQTALENLPEREKAFLSGNALTILDWGCGFGDGVAALASAFPQCRVSGLDFSETAILQARIRNAGNEFIWSEDGEILGDFDVIVASNCLELFEQPLAWVEKHVAACRNLYIALLPYDEYPLHPRHRSQFRAESFPTCVRNFTRIHTAPLLVDPHFWPGPQMLVVYASESYLQNTVSRRDSIDLAVARLVAAQLADRQRAAAAEAGRDAERQRADTAETILRAELDEIGKPAANRAAHFSGAP